MGIRLAFLEGYKNSWYVDKLKENELFLFSFYFQANCSVPHYSLLVNTDS